MGEQSILNSAEKTPQTEAHNDASEALRLSLTKSELVADPTGGVKTNSERTLEAIAEYKAGRYALVTAEGLSLLPSGVVNGVKHNWDNPGEFALKMGTAAAMGAGIRLLVPQAGAARAVVGTIFTYMMVKDAAMPVVGAWQQVSDDKSLANIHAAATQMSDGLGLFAVDMAAGLPIGLAADKLTGLALTKTATGQRFETWKEGLYNGAAEKIGILKPRTDVSGKQMSMEDQLKSIKDGTNGKPLTIDEKMKLIRDNLDHSHGLPRNLTPDAEAAFKAYLEHKRWHKNDMPNQIDQLLGENVAKADGAVKAPTPDLAKVSKFKLVEPQAPEAGGAKPGGTKPGGSDTPVKTGDPAIVDKPAAPAPKPLSKDAQTVQQMAATMRDLAAETTEIQMKIDNFKESVQSPLTQTMRTGKPPLDEGHFANNKALVDLTSQIQTPEHMQQAGFLLEHHRVANVQMGIPKVMPEIVDLNQYSRSVHKNLMDLLVKNGINPENVLRGTNSPIFLIFDSSGSGPYTIPAIKGVTDTAVVVLPREYKQMLGVHVSGVYAHELGHDLIYGDLLRFPESLREHVLRQDVVAAAMKAKGIADSNVDIPGVGQMKKSDFFTKLLLAEANENTADIFGTAIDPNTPLSLATLLGSLRKPLADAPKGSPGPLETRSMYGKEFVAEGNPLGIEPHGIDAWRVKLGAEVLRQLSNNNSKIVAHAAKLDALAESLRRPGDNYVWASMDNQGKFVSIPVKEWDAIIPGIVKAQLETPLPALNNRMLRDVYPDMNKIFPKVDNLAEQMAQSARSGDQNVKGFDKAGHGIEDVYSAGLSGWMKALAQNPEAGKPGHIPPDVLLGRINGLSQNLTSLYRGDNFLPATPAGPAPRTISFENLVTRPANFLGKNVGEVVNTHPMLKSTFNNWTTKTAVGTGLALTRNMLDAEKKLQELAKKTGS